jgi:hypothetical protein
MVEYEDSEAMDADGPAKPTRMKSTVHTAQGRNIKVNNRLYPISMFLVMLRAHGVLQCYTFA